MIISEKYKYIFVGLPYSASSAISKELISIYGGTALYHKHANIPLLKIMSNIKLTDYYVFAVARDPVDVVFSVYNKMLTNAHRVFTDDNHFIENGGFVTKSNRRIFDVMQRKHMTFDEYLKYVYRYHPYDNDLTLNSKYVNKFISFSELANDFEDCLNDIGIKVIRKIPYFNKTKKIYNIKEVSSETINNVFGPYYYYNRNVFESKSKINLFQIGAFKLYHVARYMNRMKYDIVKMNSNFSFERLMK